MSQLSDGRHAAAHLDQTHQKKKDCHCCDRPNMKEDRVDEYGRVWVPLHDLGERQARQGEQSQRPENRTQPDARREPLILSSRAPSATMSGTVITVAP